MSNKSEATGYWSNFSKIIALNCVRNTSLEDIHAGTFPSSKTGDYSDVKVVTPYGEIPWNSSDPISGLRVRSSIVSYLTSLPGYAPKPGIFCADICFKFLIRSPKDTFCWMPFRLGGTSYFLPPMEFIFASMDHKE